MGWNSSWGRDWLHTLVTLPPTTNNQQMLLGAPIRDKPRKLGMGLVEIRTNSREEL